VHHLRPAGPIPTDDRERFTRAEFVAAFRQVVSTEEAERWTYELLAPRPEAPSEFDTHLSDDVLDLLSLVSDGCAERVRAIMNLNDKDAAARRDRLRNRIRTQE